MENYNSNTRCWRNALIITCVFFSFIISSIALAAPPNGGGGGGTQLSDLGCGPSEIARVKVTDEEWECSTGLTDTELMANNAYAKANNALGAANTAQTTADGAVSDAAAAQLTADRATIEATRAQQAADRALIEARDAFNSAIAAQGTADTAVSDSAAAQAAADAVQADVDALEIPEPTAAYGPHVAIVAPDGGDYTSPLDAMANVDTGDNWCGTPSVSNPCLVKIMPGVYDLGSADSTPLVMREYVDIMGSGQNNTRITSTGSSVLAGTINGADNATLSNLRVDNTGGTSNAIGILNQSASPNIAQVAVRVSGGSIGNYGIYNRNGSSASVTYIDALASGGVISAAIFSIFNDGAAPIMTHVVANATGATDNNTGVSNGGDSPTMTFVTAKASGGINSRGVLNGRGVNATMKFVTAIASNASSQNMGILNGGTTTADISYTTAIASGGGGTFSFGIRNDNSTASGETISIRHSHVEASGATSNQGITSNGDTLVTVDNTSIVGASNTISSFSNNETFVGNSKLDGGAVNIGAGGAITCAGVTDENYVFYPNACP